MVPAATAAISITGMSRPMGILLPQASMQPAVAQAPISTWPSAPRFQNFILKAGVTASEMQSSSAVFCMVIQTLRVEPKLPLNIET